MSALIFVRDGRTLPFVPITIAAMDAIREATPKGRPYAVATYVALLELANQDRADRVAITLASLTEMVGAGRTTVREALTRLVAAGVVEVREQMHGRGQLAHEYVVCDPTAESDTPAQSADDPPPPIEHPADARPSQPSAAQAVIQTAEKKEKKNVPGEGIQRRVEVEQRSVVIDLFEHWQLRCSKPSSKPTRERLEKVKARLNEGYTVEQIRTAIDGAACGAFVNDSGKRFDDLELICRTGSKLESFIDRAASPIANGGNVHPIRSANGTGSGKFAALMNGLDAANPRLQAQAAQAQQHALQLPERT